MTSSAASGSSVEKQAGWGVIGMLAAAQFIMVLDTTVMNVSISQVTADLNTTIVGLQSAITLYTLVMAAFMLLGGKLGGRWGAKRAFWIGLLVYGTGSLITAFSPTLGVLLVGWSLIEGLGAILVIPAIAALTAATYTGKQRALCYGILGGVSGASAAAGPLIGGWVTAYYSWRYVFAGETVRRARPHALPESHPGHRRPQGQARSGRRGAVGGGPRGHRPGRAAVQPVGMADSEGRQPRSLRSGLSPTLWLIIAGAVFLYLFAAWERRVVGRGEEPLLDLKLLAHRDDARWTRHPVVPGVHHPGHVLRAAPVPADGAGLRLAADRARRSCRCRSRCSCSRSGGSAATNRFSPKRIVLSGIAGLLVGEVHAALLPGTRPSLVGLRRRSGAHRGRPRPDGLAGGQRHHVVGRRRLAAAKPAACRARR